MNSRTLLFHNSEIVQNVEVYAVSKGDAISGGLTLIAAAIGYFVGGPKAIICAAAGILLLVWARFKREKQAPSRSETPALPGQAFHVNFSPVISHTVSSGPQAVPQEEKRPFVSFDFDVEPRGDHPPEYAADPTLEIIDRGEWPISDVAMQATEYTLEQRRAIVACRALEITAS